MAATNEVVAIAFAKASSESSGDRIHCLSQPWNVTLLFFDAGSGKLLGKSGPWTSYYMFEVFAGPQGNFLLHYQRHHKTNDRFSDFLVLTSLSGSVLKQLELEPIATRAKGSLDRMLVSPSGATVYIGELGDDGWHCRILETQSLTERQAWLEPRDADAPQVLAISDQEMLGTAEPLPRINSGLPELAQAPLLRTFGGNWRKFPATERIQHEGGDSKVSASAYGFVGNYGLFALEKNGEEETIHILRTDGTAVSTSILPKRSHAIRFPIALNVSQDGHYFGFLGAHENWGNHVMLDVLKWDDTFWSDDAFVYVWQMERPEAIAKISLGPGETHFVVVGGDFPGIAAIRGLKLTFKRVQATPEK